MSDEPLVPNQAPLLTIADIARRAKSSHKSVRRWIERGDLAAYKVGGCWRISEDDYAEFLAERRVTNRT